MNNPSVIKNRIFHLFLILFISLGVVGVTLTAAGHMGGSNLDVQYNSPQIQAEVHHSGSLPPSPIQVASKPVQTATLGDPIGDQMRLHAMAYSRASMGRIW